MRRAAIFVLLAFGLSGGGSAIAAGESPCSKSLKQQDRNACIADAFRKSDAVLDRAYGELKEKLDATGKRNLVAAEKAWIAFRDAECDLRSGYDDEHIENNGTIAPFLVGSCKLELTQQRTAELRKQLECPGGDLSCAP